MINKRVQRWIDKGLLEITDECWYWRGCKNSDGYPKVSDRGDVNGKGHRVMYQFCNPDENIQGKVIRHSCDNPLCMKPEHLSSGTFTDNMIDRHTSLRTRSQVSEAEIFLVSRGRELGYSYNQISRFTHINKRRVEYIIKKYVRSEN